MTSHVNAEMDGSPISQNSHISPLMQHRRLRNIADNSVVLETSTTSRSAANIVKEEGGEQQQQTRMITLENQQQNTRNGVGANTSSRSLTPMQDQEQKRQ